MLQNINKFCIPFLFAISVLYFILQEYPSRNYPAKVLSIPRSNTSSNYTPSAAQSVASTTGSSILEKLFSDTPATNVSTGYNLSTTTAGAEIETLFGNTNCKIVVCSIGNLGNQIWEYMSLFVVWKRYMHSGYEPYIEESMFSSLKVLFSKLSISPSSPEELCSVPKEKIILKNNSLRMYDSWFEVSHEKKCENVYLDQYSSRYEEILKYGVAGMRKEMSFAPHLVTDCQNVLLYYKKQYKLQDEDVIFVGMHYRGTDYVHHLDINYASYKPKIPTYEYYVEAMRRFKKKYKNKKIIFILITIDHHWLNKNINAIVNGSNVIVNPTRGDRLKDLVLLSQCDHNIINYGTFGATAALLAGGDTFVYDLKLPLDHRGSTLAMGLAKLLKDWETLS